jgi:hypothetical protein
MVVLAAAVVVGSSLEALEHLDKVMTVVMVELMTPLVAGRLAAVVVPVLLDKTHLLPAMVVMVAMDYNTQHGQPQHHLAMVDTMLVVVVVQTLPVQNIFHKVVPVVVVMVVTSAVQAMKEKMELQILAVALVVRGHRMVETLKGLLAVLVFSSLGINCKEIM